MNHSAPIQPYCKAAIFKCSCCGYETTMYSNVEWVIINEESFCSPDSGYLGDNAILGFIYRDDLDPKDPLHPQCTYTPLSKYGCKSWDDPNLKIHWTEQPVSCMACNDNTMAFVSYTIGANMLMFYEKCVNATKLSSIPVEWKNDHGSTYFVVKGIGSNFSSS